MKSYPFLHIALVSYCDYGHVLAARSLLAKGPHGKPDHWEQEALRRLPATVLAKVSMALQAETERQRAIFHVGH